MRTAVPIGYPIERGEVSGWLVAGHQQESPDWDMHHAFEVVVVLQGRHERWYEDGTVLEMGPGDLSLHGAWEPHGHCSPAPETLLLVLFFNPEVLGQTTLCGVPWLNAFVAPPADRPRAATPEARAQVLTIADELRGELGCQRRDLPTALQLGILRLLFAVLRQWSPVQPSDSPSRRTSDLSSIAPALNLLYANLTARRIAVREGAAACHLSPSRFATVFRRTMGLSFGQFVLRSRLAHATRLLLNSNVSVDAIATSLGFSDVSHFYHSFTKHYACTPAQYRQRARHPHP